MFTDEEMSPFEERTAEGKLNKGKRDAGVPLPDESQTVSITN